MITCTTKHWTRIENVILTNGRFQHKMRKKHYFIFSCIYVDESLFLMSKSCFWLNIFLDPVKIKKLFKKILVKWSKNFRNLYQLAVRLVSYIKKRVASQETWEKFKEPQAKMWSAPFTAWEISSRNHAGAQTLISKIRNCGLFNKQELNCTITTIMEEG